MHTGESAINRGLAKRLKDLEKERERRNRAAREDDLQFSLDFLSTWRKVFRMIDKDDSGTLEKQEVIDAVSADKKVINFLVNCGEPNLQYLLVPARPRVGAPAAGHGPGRPHRCPGVVLTQCPYVFLRRRRGTVSDSPVACDAGRTPSRTRCPTSSRSAR